MLAHEHPPQSLAEHHDNQDEGLYHTAEGQTDRTRLCDVCDTIDFTYASSEFCSDHWSTAVGTELRGLQETLEVGPLRRLEEGQACPGCYLILSCLKTYYKQDLPPQASKIWLWRVQDDFTKQPFSREGRDKATLETALQISVCSHGLPGGKSEPGDDTVGSIKPLLNKESSLGLFSLDVESFAASISGPKHGILTRNVAKFADTDLMRDWLDHCRTEHGDVCDRRLSTSAPCAMIRLLDTKELKVIKGSLQMEYVALSYVWGCAEYVLTKSKEKSLSQPGGLHLDELPRTIRDAVILTQKLGQRYIWIDSACIIQDDEVDKNQQLGHMDCVYNFANVVLVPANSACSHIGIPGVETARKGWNSPRVSIRGTMYTAQLPGLRVCLDSSKWQTRGWTFQEGFLARRMLVFDDNQVYWNCRVASHCENVFSESKDIQPVMAPHSLLLSEDKPLWCRVDGGRNMSSIEQCFDRDHMRMIENFTSRTFSDQNDVLWAFQGILKLLKPQFPKGFIWGIPWDSIDAMLLWHVDCAFRASCASHAVQDTRQKTRKLKFPTWTWLAKGCNVHYLSCGERLVSKLTWHDTIPYLDEQEYDAEQAIEDDGNNSSTTTVSTDLYYSETDTSKNICQLGYLQFDAPVAYLEIEAIIQLESCQHGKATGQAIIKSPDGQSIGTIKCSWQFLTARCGVEPPQIGSEEATIPYLSTRYQGEFVHLSSFQPVKSKSRLTAFCQDDDPPGDGPNDWHRPGCRHADNVNLMLIEWDAEHRIAYRVGLTSIKESAWEKIQTQTRRIVLG